MCSEAYESMCLPHPHRRTARRLPVWAWLFSGLDPRIGAPRTLQRSYEYRRRGR